MLFSPLVTGLKGKSGNTIFQGGRYGYVARTSYVPRNPKSQTQTSHRGVFREIVKEWAKLTDAERASWATSVALRRQQERRKKTGNLIELTPYNFFVQVNTFRRTVALAVLKTFSGAGTTFTGNVTDANTSITLGGLRLFFTADLKVGIYVLGYLTQIVSPGISNYSGLYRYAGYIVSNSTTQVLDFDKPYDDFFPTPPPVGSNVSIRIITLSSNGVLQTDSAVKVDIRS